MSDANPPTRHHFAPVFYLKRWTSAGDGFLEQFSQPGGAGRGVRARRLPPAGTGYKDKLYSMPGLPPDREQQVETKFMQVVDDQAAKILERLEVGKPIKWDTESRSAWTRFIFSLQLRTPADIAGIKQRTIDEWGVSIPLIQETYESLRRTGDPLTFEEFVTSTDPLLLGRAAIRIATVLIDNPQTGEHVNNMKWAVLDLSASSLDLLTSDRAVNQVLGLGDPRAFITLPLGPKRLFVAANKRETIDVLGRRPPRELVRHSNHGAVKLARNFVWAADRRQQAFIEAQFAAIEAPTLGEQLAALPPSEVAPQPVLA